MEWRSVLTKEWLQDGPMPPDGRYGWKAVGYRSDGYYFYVHAGSEESAKAKLNTLLDAPAPPWNPQ